MTHIPLLRRRSLIVAAGGAALAAPLRVLRAESFPSKPITLIVPWPAGGSTDRHLRTLAELAGKQLGQNVIVQNQPGGGGTNGPGAMALNAKPDGYTIAQFPMGMLRLPHMQKVNWHPINAFTFIMGISGYTFGFTVRAASMYSVNDLNGESARTVNPNVYPEIPMMNVKSVSGFHAVFCMCGSRSIPIGYCAIV